MQPVRVRLEGDLFAIFKLGGSLAAFKFREPISPDGRFRADNISLLGKRSRVML